MSDKAPWIAPQIDPIALSLGPLDVYWYGLMYALSFAFALWLATRRAKKAGSGWQEQEVSDLLFYGFIGVIIGGRLGSIFFYNFDQFLHDPARLFRIWEGGMAFHGGLLGVIVMMWWFAHKTQRSFFQVSDFIAPLIPFGLGAGRIGNFINGELWGRVTDVPWGMIFPYAGSLPRHPSQLYECLLEGVVLFCILNYAWLKKPPSGVISGLFLFFYGCFRFGIEFVREPDIHIGFVTHGLSMGQLLSLPMISLGVLFVGCAYYRSNQRAKENQMQG